MTKLQWRRRYQKIFPVGTSVGNLFATDTEIYLSRMHTDRFFVARGIHGGLEVSILSTNDFSVTQASFVWLVLHAGQESGDSLLPSSQLALVGGRPIDPTKKLVI